LFIFECTNTNRYAESDHSHSIIYHHSGGSYLADDEVCFF
jgi:hypothetical protein